MWRYVVAMAVTLGTMSSGLPCEEARMRCLYRTGCSVALQDYFSSCSSVLHGAPSNFCPTSCRDALIALTSTDEGQELMKCKCSDKFCSEPKQRIEVCRHQVLSATDNRTQVTCHVAQLICLADAECSMALEYYNSYCRAMFIGRKCTKRCNNSISILQRQEKAAKLNACLCSGDDVHYCKRIQNNMARLCFHSKQPHREVEEDNDLDNELRPSSSAASGLVLGPLLLVLLLMATAS